MNVREINLACTDTRCSISRTRANNFSFLKGHMSDQVSILVGQNRNAVGRFLLIIFKWIFSEIKYFSASFTYYLVKEFVWT